MSDTLTFSRVMLIFSSVSFFCIHTVSCDKPVGSNSETPETVEERAPVSVETVPATMTEIQPCIKSFGSISYKSKTDISPAVEGILKALYVDEGNRVYAGRLLAEIENLQLEIQANQSETAIVQAEAALRLAEAKYWEGLLHVDARLLSIEKLELSMEQQQRELAQLEEDIGNKERLLELDGVSREQVTKLKLSYESARTSYENSKTELEIKNIGFRDADIISRGLRVPYGDAAKREIFRKINNLTLAAEVEAAKAGLESARTARDSVDLLIEKLQVYAPVGGIVGAKYLEEGERITAEARLFTIFNENPVYAVFPVQEGEAFCLRQGLPVAVTVPSLGEEEIQGIIDLISPTVDPQSGNVLIKALVHNPRGHMKPGMFIRAEIRYGEPEQKILIPETALIKKEGDKGYIFVCSGERTFRRTITLGPMREGMVQVLSGLMEGEIVIDSPPPVLREGDRVAVEG